MIAETSIRNLVESVDIADVVGQFVELKNDGPAKHKGCCPFHDEKTPSFKINSSKGFYKCFGCGKSGDAITFLREHQGLDFIEACKWLSSKFNIDLEFTGETIDPEEAKKRKQQRKTNLQLLDTINQIYRADNEPGISYLQARNIYPKTARNFQIGYVPKNGLLLSKLEEQDCTTALALGYLIQKEKRTFELFRDGVIFPIHDHTGQVRAFANRRIHWKKGDESPKYMNSKGVEGLYEKEKVLYGLFFAQREIRSTGYAYLVEGYTDVLMMAQEGFENVVAPCGTSFTKQQAILLKKYTDHVRLVFDGDRAGEKAMLAAIEILLPLEFNVEVCFMPVNEDPASVLSPRTDYLVGRDWKVNLPTEVAHIRRSLLTDHGYMYDAVSIAAQKIVSKDATPAIHQKEVLALGKLLSIIPGEVTRSEYIKQFASIKLVDKDYLKKAVGEAIRTAKNTKKLSQNLPKNGASKDVQFWDWEEDQSGNPKPKFNYDVSTDFLYSKGFHSVTLSDREDHLVCEQSKCISEVSTNHIRRYVVNYLKEHHEQQISNMVRSGLTRYFSDMQLLLLKPLEIQLMEDDKEVGHVYFNNTWFAVEKGKIEQHDYSLLSNNIWSNQKIDHDIEFTGGDNNPSMEDGHFAKFLALAIGGPNTHLGKKRPEYEYETREDLESSEAYQRALTKFHSACSAIGYLMHRYKDPTDPKAIIQVDQAISYSKQGAKGGTGKGVFQEAIGLLLNSPDPFNGYGFNPTRPESWSQVTHSTDLIRFDEFDPKADFRPYFSFITGGIRVKNLYRDPYTIDKRHSPKFLVATNYTIKGDTSSYIRRQHLIEFSDYFDEKYQPIHELEIRLFDDWNDEEWNRFYSFCVKCLHLFLEKGLIPFPMENYGFRQLLATMPEDAIDFFDNQVEVNVEYEKKKMYEEFTTINPDFETLRINSFTRWLHAWADYKGYVINPEKAKQGKVHGRDNRNGTDYIKAVDILKQTDKVEDTPF